MKLESVKRVYTMSTDELKSLFKLQGKVTDITFFVNEKVVDIETTEGDESVA